MDPEPLSRRRFLQAATVGSLIGVNGVGVVGGQGGVRPDFGGYLDGVDGGFRDGRGESEVVVSVGAQGNDGAFAFDPAGVWVDVGTTVVWEWTGEGGSHNVHGVSGPVSFESELMGEAGASFEFVFEEGGVYEYQCDPHADLGMLGAVAVGDEVPTTEPDTGGAGPTVPESVKAVGIAMFVAMSATLGLAFFFLKYGGGGPEDSE